LKSCCELLLRFLSCYVLAQVGKRHDLSAGLLIGGKNVAEEASRVNSMNILVATPGGCGVLCCGGCTLQAFIATAQVVAASNPRLLLPCLIAAAQPQW
jgi:hypothetical protein